MKKYKIASIIAVGLMTFTSCLDDLDQLPIDPNTYSEVNVYKDEVEAQGAFAKLYSALAITGQKGPAGAPDIDGSIVDEGTSQFSRLLFYPQELSTDNAVVAWGDDGVPDFHNLSWSASNPVGTGLYFRLAQEVSYCNSFIQKAANVQGSEIPSFIAEARFLRAYAYYNLIDLYGDVPLVKEVSTDLPSRASREEVFNFIESELKECVNDMKAPRTNQFGRVDQAAAWGLLARLYLNAEVYTGKARYADAAMYAEKVINSGYKINTNDANGNGTAYDELFLADNDTNGAQDEFVFALNYNGIQTQTYGGTTFLVHASLGGSANAEQYGVNGGWAGLRVTPEFVQKFKASGFDNDGFPIKWSDKRAMFFTEGQSLDINTVSIFDEGYMALKFSNMKSDGTPGDDASGTFVDTNLPLIRVAEMNLIYAEAAARGEADKGKAANYVNQLRERAFGNAGENINASSLTLDFILDERARELYWEGFRRTDLIRFNQYTNGSYLWTFKGGVKAGTSVGAYRNVLPIPTAALQANPNLTQNTGY